MTIAICIVGGIVTALQMIIIFGIIGLYGHQRELKKELKEAVEKKQVSPEVTVNFPYDSLLGLETRVAEMEQTSFAVYKLMGLVANAEAVNLTRIMEKDDMGQASITAITELNNSILQAIHYFYAPREAETEVDGGEKEEENQ